MLPSSPAQSLSQPLPLASKHQNHGEPSSLSFAVVDGASDRNDESGMSMELSPSTRHTSATIREMICNDFFKRSKELGLG